MKNILVVATFFPPAGGIGTVRVTKYVKYLKKFNWNPTVVTITDKFIEKKDETLLKDIGSDVKIYRLEFKRKNKDISIDFYNALKKQIGQIIEKQKYDMLYITVGPFGILPIGEYIYKKYRIKYIIDMRDPWKLQKLHYNNKINCVFAKIKKSIKGIIENKSFKNASYICTVNDTMTKEYANEYPKYSNKFITIPNGIDKDDYSNIVAKKNNRFTIVYAGKFDTAAGFRDPSNIFSVIRNLINKNYDIQFMHIGDIEDKIVNIAKKVGIIDNCQFLGRKSYKETLEYCKGANILLVIGGNEKSEQTGKIFDYIGCSRPIMVLANKNSEINVVCEKVNNTICMEKNDTKNMEQTIISLYKSNEGIEETNIPKEYTREFLTKKLSEILNKAEKG